MDFDNIKRVLVIKLRHIGDVLLTVPVFRALREKFPDSQITALVNSGTEDALEGNPLIDGIITLDRGIKELSPLKRYWKEADFLCKVRKRCFDMTVDLTGGDRAAIISLASGARHRLGWETRKGFIGKRVLYTHLYKPDGRRHMVLQNLDVVRQFDISTENTSIDFYIPEADRDFIKNIIKENSFKETDTIVHVHPTSRWLFKCWKDEYMAEVISWLIGQEVKVIVTSSPDKREMEKARRILSLVGDSPDSTASPVNLGQSPHGSRLVDLCGETTIKQLAAVSEASDLFFGVDSAPMHIAAAVGTPVIALFGPSGSESWGPWDNSQGQGARGKGQGNLHQKRNGIQTFGMHTVIQRDWDCVPCGKDGCDGSKISRCLEDIKPQEVKAVIEERLENIKK